MALPVIATKGNLIQTKKSLELAKLGYDLLDRKRNILIREVMTLIDTAKELRGSIADTYSEAFLALQRANITMGVCESIAKGVPIEHGVHVSYRSVMGVEIPHVTLDPRPPEISYGLINSNSQIDRAYIQFGRAKQLTVVLAEVENSVYRLANAIKKTQRRANALQNIIIPQQEAAVKYITEALEEKEREEFSRLKVIKQTKAAKKTQEI